LAAIQTRTRVLRGYDSMRVGEIKGLRIYFVFYLPILVLMDNRSYMSFLEEGHVVLDFM